MRAVKPPENAVFVETWASGRNLGSWRLRRGGASNCLLVALANDRLITALQPPFNLFPPSGLEHDIPLGSVVEITEAIGSWRGPSVRVRFKDESGKEQAIELLLKNQRRFMEALRSLEAASSVVGPRKFSDGEYDAVAMLPLGEALRSYWLYLVGVCLFPTFAFVGFELFGLRAAWVVAPVFYLTFLLAMKPVLARRAPMTFWLVVVALWTGSAVPAALLVQLIKWVRHL